MLRILEWVEKCDQQTITPSMMAALDADEKTRTGLDVVRLSGVLWGFLNTCLKADAHTVFEGADTLHGLEGWRLVV